MYGTVIIDTYTKNEINKIAEALDDLCSPNDGYGWASSGIYSFWNYYTKELYYIGLTVDLTERFKQHNGIRKIDSRSCKYKQILNYFDQYDKLGYSIFVHSSIDQPVTSKNIYRWAGYDPAEHSIRDFSDERSRIHLKMVEGILIETYRIKHGVIPPWNQVQGYSLGQSAATQGNYEIINCFTHDYTSPLVSRYTLRELSENPTYATYEIFLHGARQLMLNMGLSYGEALKWIRNPLVDPLNTYDDIVNTGYYRHALNI